MKFIKTGKNIILSHGNKVVEVSKKSKKYSQLMRLLKAKKEKAIIKIFLSSDDQRIRTYTNNSFYIQNNDVFIKGGMEPVHPLIASKIIQFYKAKAPYSYLIKFWKNLQKNPSENSKNQLFQFLDRNNFPITFDGCFLAYKKVCKQDGKLLDLRTRTMDNSVGKWVSIPREKVNSDPDVGCGTGLHIASFNYAYNFYGNNGKELLVEIKVNPKDVVSVPTDCEFEKMRVCRYFVNNLGKSEIKSVVIKRSELNNKLISSLPDGTFCLETLTSKEIINLVNSKFGKKITLSLKNKKPIVKKATEIFVSENYRVV